MMYTGMVKGIRGRIYVSIVGPYTFVHVSKTDGRTSTVVILSVYCIHLLNELVPTSHMVKGNAF